MSTKSQITTAIQSKLTGSAEDLTWDRHEEFLIDEDDSILENLYNTTTTKDDQTTTNVCTVGSSGGITINGLEYDFYIKKQGGIVNFSGQLRNTLSTISDIGVVARVTNSEYNPTSTDYQVIVNALAYTPNSTAYPLRMGFGNTGDFNIRMYEPLAPQERVNFNFNYHIAQ